MDGPHATTPAGAARSWPRRAVGILDLNDDCLCNVLERLEVQEQLRAAHVCERFRWVVSQMVWKRRFQEARTIGPETDALSHEEYLAFFRLVAEHLRRLTIVDTKHLAFTSYLSRYTWRPELPFYLSVPLPRLVELECLDGRLHDGLLRLVAKNCPKLQVLRASSEHVTGAHLKDMRTLRELHLPRCSLRAEHCREICQQLNLTHLDISGSGPQAVSLAAHAHSRLRYLKISELSIDIVFAEKCPELRELRTLVVADLSPGHEANSNWQRLLANVGARVTGLKVFNAHFAGRRSLTAARLPALRRLFIKARSPDSCLEAFDSLASLEELQVYSYVELSPVAFAGFVARSPRLRAVDLVCCETMFDLRLHWIFDLIELLQAPSQAGRCPLALNIGHSELRYFDEFMVRTKRTILEDFRYSTQSMLRLTFNVPPIRHAPSLDACFELEFGE